MNHSYIRRTAAGVLVIAVTAFALPLAAQTGGAGTGGVARLAQEQKLAGSWRRVLMIGAHPDDEDTELLTVLSRGEGITAAYLSLNRGEGGQNLIGNELGEALGVLRTEELMSARRIDGAQQFFTRAFDFGFSKTSDETLRFWNRDSIVKDMVRIIRRFRPQVVVSVFSGTPADGHGHHQVAGILTPEAYHAAGDPARFPELQTEEHLAPWQPSKLYRDARGGGGGATLTFNGGVIDPAVGMSLHQIAARSRSQHRSQNQGELEELGPSRTGVRLVERVASITGNDDSLFAGIKPEPAPQPDAHANEARLITAGIVLDATTDADEVTPGEVLPARLTLWNTGHDTVQVEAAMVPHNGLNLRSGDCGAGAHLVAPGVLYRCTATVTVAEDARPTSPYYLARPLAGAMYQWSGNPALWGEPEAPPIEATFRVALGGYQPMTLTRELAGRFRDPVLGEVRHPVMIVQPITVALEPAQLLWPASTHQHQFDVALEHLASDSSDAIVSLTLPSGWKTGAPQPVHFTRQGERATIAFTVTTPATIAPGAYEIAARVIAGHDTLDTGLERIRYPHVRDRNIVTDARTKVVVTDIAFAAVGTIGYVRGGGDMMPEAMTNAGLPVALLTGDALERDPLSQYKVIVIGPRAYEADQSLDRANPRLMRWLEAGGTLVIEYQQSPYVRGGFAPRALNIGTPTQNRVTDETAPVHLIAPAEQVLRWPNPIGARDFVGWIQERGLDFPPSWDPAWKPVLETHDSGDVNREGGLLVAHVGKGTAVYTGLSFHRQLPAVVPGAWRLWANILAVGQHPPAAGGRATAH
ncbi:MAG TPA: PIG-L family deacetylase [Gemmatimonadales bacterium]|jgi:LmbE family N-acetylglucosaminyl deacetylase